MTVRGAGFGFCAEIRAVRRARGVTGAFGTGAFGFACVGFGAGGRFAASVGTCGGGACGRDGGRCIPAGIYVGLRLLAVGFFFGTTFL